ncbi:MAG: hypothetical protein QOH39_3386 [Verrucomicrobiota bacterium]|jgi:hypothetical protein
MTDLLAAASLLLTVITILYSIWYPEVSEALKLPIDEHPLNNKEAHGKCRALLMAKVIPLAIVATALCFINFPDTWEIVIDATAQLRRPVHADYSAVRTAFVVVELVLAFLAVHTIWTAKMLRQQVIKLNPGK